MTALSHNGRWHLGFRLYHLEIGPTRSNSITQRHQETFSTREAGEAAAFEAAQAEIDAHGPLT